MDDVNSSILVLCAGGLEWFVVELMLRDVTALSREQIRLLTDGIPGPGQAGVGKILVSFEPTRDVHAVVDILRLPYIIFVYVTVTVANDVDSTSAQDCADRITLSRLQAAELHWRRVNAHINEILDASEGPARGHDVLERRKEQQLPPQAVGQNAGATKFRCSCIRSGSHQFKSMDVARKVGAVADELMPHWQVDLTNFDLELVAIVSGKEPSDASSSWSKLVVGIAVPRHFDQTSKGAVLPKDQSSRADVLDSNGRPRSFALRLSHARLLVELACAVLGRVPTIVFDPFAGLSTITIDASKHSNHTFGLASDLDHQVLSAGALRATTCSTGFMIADILHLPLRRQIVEACIIEAPFGVRCGKSRDLEKLLVKGLDEVWSILDPHDSVCILLCTTRRLAAALNQSGKWTIAPAVDNDWRISALEVWTPGWIRINIGGLLVELLVFRPK
ncbi:THUMP domain-containing protein 3 [Porphyridium purpureum]|uniref:THUMP domain-containing protein 3 n=1 Tax=Porphyridium purpureum TaxID=35688 RepID=A0A5J4YHX1_PORPP|nr:THUMP domain-containing protein 3 [Porphyridium purpureum]|eukprot:POR6864..scf297_16